MKGKFSNLPERFRRLGLLPATIFYLKMKKDSHGEGYEEIITVLEQLNNLYQLYGANSLANKIYLNMDSANLEDSEKLLLIYENILSTFIKLKYLIKAYIEK